MKREVEVLVLSDIHLGTYGCRAKELLRYLKSVDPKLVILNGDIIDFWQFRKRYWPKSHMKVLRHILKWIGQEIPIYYITGNHDELLRKFKGYRFGSLSIVNKAVIQLDGKHAWFFHGDVFDVTMRHSKWLAKLGGWGYDFLIILNNSMNFFSEKVLGRGRLSLSKRIKNSVKSAVKYISDFELTAAEIAIENGYDQVVCGHIHQPVIRYVETEAGEVQYLNSGDWIENLSALEYNAGEWTLYRYEDALEEESESMEDVELDAKELFMMMQTEFRII
jgi:UDP-2,3-diacylglucosamine pyrophosphatase LpxH